jgi:hypothetical protein
MSLGESDISMGEGFSFGLGDEIVWATRLTTSDPQGFRHQDITAECIIMGHGQGHGIWDCLKGSAINIGPQYGQKHVLI